MFIPYIVLRLFGIDVNTQNEKSQKNENTNVDKANIKKFKKYKDKPNYDKEKEVIKPGSIEVEDAFQRSPENNPVKDISKYEIVKSVPFNISTSFIIDIEMILGKGEDAPPILIEFQDSSKIIGVADGMGGAGGTVYKIDSTQKSGAYLASRAITSIAEKYFLDFKTAGYDINENNVIEIAKDLKYHFDSGLAQILDKINEAGNVKLNIKSTLIRRLPTTFALSYIKNEYDNLKIYNFWAGDSRIYALDSSEGLHQLTIDDLRNSGDAYDNLMNDSPISNCINGDGNYQINVNSLTITSPIVLIAATDGAFAYLQTPIHFERLLLETLNDSSNMETWKRNLEKSLSINPSDDISLSLIIIGYRNFLEIKDNFFIRFKLLVKQFEKLDGLIDKLKLQENKVNNQNTVLHEISHKEIECEKAIVSANDRSNLLTRTINDLEYDLSNSKNQIERKKKEIEEIEKAIERKKYEITLNSKEIDEIEREIKVQTNKLEDYKKTRNNIVDESVSQELKTLNETNNKLRKELWQQYKEKYEKYFNHQE